jgi:hypothetical protein
MNAPTPPTPPTPEDFSVRKWLLGVEPTYLPMADEEVDGIMRQLSPPFGQFVTRAVKWCCPN